MTTAVHRVCPDDPQFPEVVALFDDYRRHYGEDHAPDTVGAWLREQHDTHRLRVYAAGDGVTVGAILTLCVLPASLSLRTWWSVRDLWVGPGARRGGLARALLAHVAAAARAEGALRLALQTEVDNTEALALYAGSGFQPVTGLTHLTLTW